MLGPLLTVFLSSVSRGHESVASLRCRALVVQEILWQVALLVLECCTSKLEVIIRTVAGIVIPANAT